MARREHVHELDVVRVLTFACVIAVHTVSYTESSSSVPAWGLEMVLHFTREAFFFLTGAVLVHQSLGRPMVVTNFWRRRLVAVGVPYVAWSVIYTLVKDDGSLRTLPHNLALGVAWYHLYFLLVSMQIYVLFPAIYWLVRRTARHHGLLLLVSAGIQLAILALLAYPSWRPAWFSGYANHSDILLPSYQFYVLLGAVVAWHLDRVRAFVRAHRPLILTVTALGAVVAETWYLVWHARGASPVVASMVLQPIMLPWSIAAIGGLFVAGDVWAQRRRAGSGLDRGLAYGSDRSFGVFLVHPLVLWLVLKAHSRWFDGFHGAAYSVVAYLLVVAGAVVLTELFRRSPLSLALTGRGRLTPARPTAAAGSPREESRNAQHNSQPASAPVEAPHSGPHDGDRRRPAYALLRRRGLELQRSDRRDEAGVGNLAGH